MAEAVKLSSYRVSAAMDASAYTAGMAQKVAADKAGAASAAQVGAAVTATQSKVSQSGDVLTRLSRSYVDGYGQAERFTRAVNTLGRGIETGNVPMARAEVILDGIYRKFGLTANAADLAEQGHYQLAAAVTALNGKLAANDNALDLNSAAHQRNAAAMRQSNAQRTNLMFQLQDIGVSLAGGMNPLMVFMQQGSQISMIYGNGEGGLGRAFSETGKMAAGLVTRLWPLAILAAAVTTGFAAMATEFNRGRAAAERVNIGQVFQASFELAWEAFQRFASPVTSWFGSFWDAVSPTIAAGVEWLIDAFDLAFRNISTIWSQLPAMLGDLTMTTAQLVVDGTEWMVNKAIDAINWLTGGTRDLMKLAGLNVAQIGRVELGDLPNKWKGSLGGIGDKLHQNLVDVRSTSTIDAITTRAAQIRDRPSDEDIKAAEKEAERQRKAYDDLTRSAQQRVAQAQMEISTLGMTREAAERLRIEQELLNKAANDNLDLTPKQTEALRLLAAETAAAEERARQLKEIYDFGKETFRSFFSDLKTDLMSGASLWDAFANAGANALDRIADRALGMAADGIFDMIFGAVMGGLGGGATGGTWGNGLWGSAIFNAKGNVYASRGLHQYANQVVDRPTVFPFAKGGTFGVMGEAGAEAIMPLRRGRDGKLGVEAANSNDMTVNVYNQSGSRVVTRKRTGTNGKREMDLYILDTVRDGVRRGAIGF